MKLVIHAGLHKTATSTFQKICRLNEDLLLRGDVMYPRFKEEDQHSFLMWRIQNGDDQSLKDLLRDAKQQVPEHGTVLLSGEDFENCIIEIDIALRVEEMATELGFDAIEWVFVTRNPFEYLNSSYAENCKHDITINYELMATAILREGFITLASANFRRHSVFDYARFFERFQSSVSGGLRRLDYRDFCDGFPGRSFLQDVLGAEIGVDLLGQFEVPTKRENARMTPRIVEYLYLCNFIGMKPDPDFFKSNKAVLDPLIKTRVQAQKRMQQTFERKFAERFST